MMDYFYSYKWEQFECDFSGYRDFLGSGGFAEVYKAKACDRRCLPRWYSKEFVAAKILGSGRRTRLDESEMKALRKEVRLLGSMTPHNNIVRMIGVCDDPRDFALLLEYVEGGKLSQMIDSRAFTEWGGRLDAAVQIVTGMSHLHSLQPPIVHLDLKPDNVLVERVTDGRVYKISDFGLSKMRGISSRTARSDVKDRPSGTPAYTAPERFTTHLDLARHAQAAMKVDVYSFGIMLWELKECQIYKPDPFSHVVIGMKEIGVGPWQTNTSSPKGYDYLMEKCYSKNPEERPTFSILRSNLKQLPATPIHSREPSTAARSNYAYGNQENAPDGIPSYRSEAGYQLPAAHDDLTQVQPSQQPQPTARQDVLPFRDGLTEADSNSVRADPGLLTQPTGSDRTDHTQMHSQGIDRYDSATEATKLTPDEVVKVARKIAGSWYVDVLCLDADFFSDDKINQIKAENHNTIAQARAALSSWLIARPAKATLYNMIKGLCEAGHRGQAEEVFTAALVARVVPN
jgi:serine/threonine protein kinase